MLFCTIEREIVIFGSYSDDFLETIPEKGFEKIDYIFMLLRTEERITQKFVKHISNGLYEILIQVESNIYRIFFCFDEGRLVILFNGFQKKTQKTPTKEINRALKIMKDYYENKKQ